MTPDPWAEATERLQLGTPVATLLLLALLVLVIAVSWRLAAASSPTAAPRRRPGSTPDTGRVWVVVNPIKPADYWALRGDLDAECEALTGSPACWLETTVEEPGTRQAITALTHRPRVVIAAGGDGTVRAVAAGMAHSPVPMGIVPVGTGNLFARNLDLPLRPLAAFKVALQGMTRPADLAWLRMERVQELSETHPEGAAVHRAQADGIELPQSGSPEAAVKSAHQPGPAKAPPQGSDVARKVTEASQPGELALPQRDEFAYLVIAGIGFDGETMANTSPSLKRKVGWSAYVLTALKSLRIARMKATIRLEQPQVPSDSGTAVMAAVPQPLQRAIRDSQTLQSGGPATGGEPLSHAADHVATRLQARTVLIANCGELPFAVLSPYAEIDDGLLDVIAIDTKAGLAGWANLSVKIMSQAIGARPFNTEHDLSRVAFSQVPRVQVDTNRAYPVQVDGDYVGSARTVQVRVAAGALRVRVRS